MSSILLDGHHKAAACASTGNELPCLVIVPHKITVPLAEKGLIYSRSIRVDSLGYSESYSFSASANVSENEFHYFFDGMDRKAIENDFKNKWPEIIKRDWEGRYRESYKYYPRWEDLLSVEDY